MDVMAFFLKFVDSQTINMPIPANKKPTRKIIISIYLTHAGGL
jgi:hypothetical protein